MEEELRITYQVLCGVSYWLRPQFAEGHEVMAAVRSQIRKIESILGIDERLALDVEPSEPKYITEIRKSLTEHHDPGSKKVCEE